MRGAILAKEARGLFQPEGARRHRRHRTAILTLGCSVHRRLSLSKVRGHVQCWATSGYLRPPTSGIN